MHRSPLLAPTLLALALPAAAQKLTPPAAPVAPGATIEVTLTNDSGAFLGYPADCALRVLRPTGELLGPDLVTSACDILVVLQPGQSTDLQLVAPLDDGAYVVVFPFGEKAVAPLLVGSGTLDRELTLFPTRVQDPASMHAVDFGAPATSRWSIGNVGSSPHAFASGERIDVLAPGGAAPLASVDLGGLVVGPGEAADVTLPVAALAPGPYELEATWTDPGTGAVETTRSGIRDEGSRVDLHLPDGRELASGSALELVLVLGDFPPAPAGDPIYVVVVGALPGTTPLPDGTLAPVVLDALVGASLASGLGGLLVNHVGTAPSIYPPGFPLYQGLVQDVTLSHPGGALGGIEVRATAIALDPAGAVWGASQPEPLLVE